MELGNLDSLRDWGYAKDYVECMWLMLQHDTPEDFVIATGEQHTVRDFAERAFAENGIEIVWKGKNEDEIGYDKVSGKAIITVNKDFYRPTDVDNLLGDPSKARSVLGWDPRRTSYESLIRIMAAHDRKTAAAEAMLAGKM